jgi:hypothetical protein
MQIGTTAQAAAPVPVRRDGPILPPSHRPGAVLQTHVPAIRAGG